MTSESYFQRNFVFHTPASFNRSYRDSVMDGKELNHWAERLISCHCFFLDDLGKSDLAAGAESELFDIVDRRLVERNRVTIITSNNKGEELASAMDSSRGEAFMRRIREYLTSFVI